MSCIIIYYCLLYIYIICKVFSILSSPQSSTKLIISCPFVFHVRNQCINCDTQFAEYHCNICNLWMEGTSKPYHCYKCGICRIGGEEQYQHCDKCGMCIDKEMFLYHNCQAGQLMAKCPVCYEDLFSSRHACHELPW